jgi:biopolymer transport protein ExbD
VQSDGRIEVDGAAVTHDELTARLIARRRTSAGESVVIRGDGQCAFQYIASVLAACRQAGISELGITVRIASIGNINR